jgi:hypothetical protein
MFLSLMGDGWGDDRIELDIKSLSFRSLRALASSDRNRLTDL